MTEAIFTQFAALLAAALLIPSIIFLAYAANHRAMSFWWCAALAYLSLFGGATFAALRSILPDLIYIFAANFLIGIGYFLCLRSIRMVKSYWNNSHIDATLTLLFLVLLTFLVSFDRTYETRVAFVSTHIAVISTIVLLIAFDKKTRLSSLGDLSIMGFCIGNIVVSGNRAAAAILDSSTFFWNLSTWDSIFFIWSIAAVFLFSIGFFINGVAIINQNDAQKLQEQQRLINELKEALEGQKDLQKLLQHELKRPINTISTTLEMLRNTNRLISKNDLRELSSLTKVATSYLEGISQFEEIDALLETPNFVWSSLHEVANDMVGKWHVKCEINTQTKEYLIQADQLLLDIALSNLIENAFKFGNSKDATTLRISHDGRLIFFDVIDDGAGISAGEHNRVFQKFHKAGTASGNALKGCGLGLYLVRKIALSHNGSAYVVSQSPSTIRFAIPVHAQGKLAQ